MASLSEHAEIIKAAIKAAEEDGYTFELDESSEGGIDYVALDIVHRGWVEYENGTRRLEVHDWDTVYVEEK